LAEGSIDGRPSEMAERKSAGVADGMAVVAVVFMSEAFGVSDATSALVISIGAVSASTCAAIASFAVVLFSEDKESF
jgi:hypothetical protein